MSTTKQERYAAALLKQGFVEIESNSGKYRTLRSPQGTLYFLGKSGAVRVGRCPSQSYAMTEAYKAALLVNA